MNEPTLEELKQLCQILASQRNQERANAMDIIAELNMEVIRRDNRIKELELQIDSLKQTGE